MADEPNSNPDGNDDESNDDTPPAPPKPATPSAKDDKPKGDEMPPELKAILDKERRTAREADKRAKAAEKELEELRTAQLSEHEKAVKAARDEGHNEGIAKGNARLLRAEVLAAASGKVADPDDVFAILANSGALADYAVNDDGEIDTAGLRTLIDDLVKTKPHLAPTRSPEFGARPGAPPAGNSSDSGMDAWLRAQAGRPT